MALVLLGLLFILVLPSLYRLYTFVYVHFLHKSTIRRYLYGLEPYCLVTGASDGIGKALAFELYRLGFNVIIHGRNATKLEGVRAKMMKSLDGKGGQVLCLVADAGSAECDFARIEKQLGGLDITVVVHNVGGSPLASESIDHQSPRDVLQIVQLNAVFPLRLTQLLLPRLRSLSGPALVLTVGSIAAEVPPPFMSPYAASKSFVSTFTRSLDFDERACLRSNVSFMYLQTGAVVTNNGVVNERAWHTPIAEDFARAAVQKVGCGVREVCPWWGHAVLRWAAQVAGEGVAERVMLAALPIMTQRETAKKDA